MALAARFDLELLQYDAVNAFVNAQLDEEIYMQMPPGYRKAGTILRLHKALYGLRRSPLLWQRELTGALQKIGFKAVPHEPCCLTCDGIVVFFYVDDIVFAFPKRKTAHAQEMIELLKARYRLTGGADLQWFLGIEIVRDRSRRLIWLSQALYIDKIAARAGRRTRKDTPIGMDELQPRIDLASLREVYDFQVKTGSILYAVVIIRPDVAFAASRIVRHNANLSQKHHDAADRILNYLQATRGYAL